MRTQISRVEFLVLEVRSLETSGTMNPTTRRQIPEALNFLKLQCEKDNISNASGIKNTSQKQHIFSREH